MIHCMLLVGLLVLFFSLFLIAYFYDAIYDLAQFDMWSLLLCIFWNISPISLFPLTSLPSFLPFPLVPLFFFFFLPFHHTFFFIGTRYKEISDFRGKFSEVMVGFGPGGSVDFFSNDITLHCYLPISFIIFLFFW